MAVQLEMLTKLYEMLSSEDQLKFASQAVNQFSEHFADQFNMYHVEKAELLPVITLRSKTNAVIEIDCRTIVTVENDLIILNSYLEEDVDICRHADHWTVTGGCEVINMKVTNIKIPLDEGDKLRDDLRKEKISMGY
jgi:hypothetical protein